MLVLLNKIAPSDFLQSALSFLFFHLNNTVGVQCFRLRPEIGCFVSLFTMLCPVFTGFTSFFNKGSHM